MGHRWPTAGTKLYDNASGGTSRLLIVSQSVQYCNHSRREVAKFNVFPPLVNRSLLLRVLHSFLTPYELLRIIAYEPALLQLGDSIACIATCIQ